MNYNSTTLEEARESIIDTNVECINNSISDIKHCVTDKQIFLSSSSDCNSEGVVDDLKEINNKVCSVLSYIEKLNKERDIYNLFYDIIYYTLVNTIISSNYISRFFDRPNGDFSFSNILLSSLSFCIKNNQSNKLDSNYGQYVFSKVYGFKEIRRLSSIDLFSTIQHSFSGYDISSIDDVSVSAKKLFYGVIQIDELKHVSFIDANKLNLFIDIRNDIIDLYCYILKEVNKISNDNPDIIYNRSSRDISFMNYNYSYSINDIPSSLMEILNKNKSQYRKLFNSVIDLVLYIESSSNSILNKFYNNFSFDITVSKISNKIDINGNRLGLSDRCRTFVFPARQFDLHKILKDTVKYSNKFGGMLSDFMFKDNDSIFMDLIRNKDIYLNK